MSEPRLSPGGPHFLVDAIGRQSVACLECKAAVGDDNRDEPHKVTVRDSFKVRPWCHTVSYSAVRSTKISPALIVAVFEGFPNVISKVDNLMDSAPTTAETSLLFRQMWVDNRFQLS